ncbi:GntR family transcriptional regulator [Sporosarcina sp. HYO08]|uniref:GntR family transcriptional regulator n=1 Tax=Sporosarcina sp. HYO08 TaxID=1759557 RepID=UPI00079B4EFA|nr:GntR family transcriptional regulator [Sporosarcina sp. HYO08]KXH87226.1 GntR family transcriptional regulator [Sporosarcina sp. HYO08]
MLIRIEPDSEIPIYLQLTHELIELMARGKLKDGDPLPSVRSFAADLGVNMHTVNKAYHELERKQFIQIIPKSGAIVSSISNDMAQFHHERITTALQPVIAEALVIGMSDREIKAVVSSIMKDLRGE